MGNHFSDNPRCVLCSEEAKDDPNPMVENMGDIRLKFAAAKSYLLQVNRDLRLMLTHIEDTDSDPDLAAFISNRFDDPERLKNRKACQGFAETLDALVGHYMKIAEHAEETAERSKADTIKIEKLIEKCEAEDMGHELYPLRERAAIVYVGALTMEEIALSKRESGDRYRKRAALYLRACMALEATE
ncbi:hypothetical protein LTR49_014918 [Elasticomyces elasticus]|nr:hypothetical protein LTR49_014918 [Elasticomyces elasticus]